MITKSILKYGALIISIIFIEVVAYLRVKKLGHYPFGTISSVPISIRCNAYRYHVLLVQ